MIRPETTFTGLDLKAVRDYEASKIAERIFALNRDCELAEEIAIDSSLGIEPREETVKELLDGLRIGFWGIYLCGQDSGSSVMFFLISTAWGRYSRSVPLPRQPIKTRSFYPKNLTRNYCPLNSYRFRAENRYYNPLKQFSLN